MIDIQKLLDIGFNCMPINADKTPMQKWTVFQDEKIKSLKGFNESDYYALITGFFDVECIDIDLKVITDIDKRKSFKIELFKLFEDNIDDFYNKVVIKKTRSGGYHIIYRAKNINGNKKITHLSAYKEAVIETRGIGGYICIYEGEIKGKDYYSIDLITDEDRDIIISCCKVLHEEVKPPIEIKDYKTIQKYKESNISPWKDYNEKTNIWDLINSEFTIVRKMPDKIIIKRHGASSPHSGYIYTNSGCLYLFSSGTKYPSEELLTPFMIYAIQHCNSNYSLAASELYRSGYGSRKRPTLNKNIINSAAKKIKNDIIDFPIDILPTSIQAYIIDSSKTLNMSIDYMSVAFLWTMSLIIGNTVTIEIKRGWSEIASLWIAIVGEAGIGKTPSLNQILRPLFKSNAKLIKQYQVQLEAYNEFNELTKKEKTLAIEIEKPLRKQFIVDDVTIEALINLHSQSINGVGVFKDELAGWFKDMNKYKEGSDKEQWLSSWSGKGIHVDRITRQSDYIKSPFMPVLGGIQPLILTGFFTDENKDNGFLDRMLFCFPKLKVDCFNESEIDYSIIEFYDNWILNLQSTINQFTRIDDQGDIEPLVSKMNPAAKKQWIKMFNEITEQQNSESTPEFLKSMLAKQKSYIPRFALIINTANYDQNADVLIISEKSMIDAYKLSKYFIKNYERLILINSEVAETNKLFIETKGNKLDKLKAIYNENPDFNRSDIAKKLNISRKTLYQYIKEIQ